MLVSPFKGREFAILCVVSLLMLTGASLVSNPYYQLVFSTIPVWATLALAWNLFSGYTGLISFGHSTFFGLGAFAVALLAIKLGISPWIGLVVAAAIGGLAAVIIGAITFRLRGHYFALAMLAYPALFIFLFDWMGWQELTFPTRRDAPWAFMQFTDGRIPTLIGAVLTILVLFGTLIVERSRFGLAMLSIKQNEAAAEAAGINTFRVKMISFIISGALTGLVGGFHAATIQIVTPQGVLGTIVSAQALILSLFGGIGTLWGPLIGAVVLVPFTEALRAELGNILPGIQGVIYGLTIMIVIIVAPEGIFWRIRDSLASRRQKHAGQSGPVATIAPPPAAVRLPVVRGDAILTVSGLSKSFGGLKAVHDVSFSIARGSIVGIIGPNGAGKTTLFNLLNGFQKPGAGSVTFDGAKTTGKAPHEVCRLGMGRTFQVARPFTRLCVLDNVIVGALAPSGSGADAIARAQRALSLVGLAGKSGAAISALTNVELRLLELARALTSSPKLVLLDETLAGLGASEIEMILPVIQALPAAGVTVIIIEHTMHAMTRLADTFIVLDHGQVIAEGPPGEVMRRPEVVEAYLGKRWMDHHAAA